MTIRAKLKRVVENTDTPWGRLFDAGIIALIIFSLVTFSIETIPGLSGPWRRTLFWCEVFVVAVFSVEYFLRIAVSDNKLKFVFSFYGVIDLLAILPFYLSLGVDLRSLRIFRLLRVFRLLKLVRYSAAIGRFRRSIYLAKEELVLFGVLAIALLWLSSVGIYYFERDAQPEQFGSIFHSLWWALATLTTVGYGDVYPVTVGGKVFTFFILTIGLGVVAVPTGIIASALTKVKEEDES